MSFGGGVVSKTIQTLEAFLDLDRKGQLPYRPQKTLELINALLSGNHAKVEELIPKRIAAFIQGTDAGLVGDREPITLGDVMECMELERLVNELKPEKGDVFDIILKSKLGLLATRCQDSEIVRRRLQAKIT